MISGMDWKQLEDLVEREREYVEKTATLRKRDYKSYDNNNVKGHTLATSRTYTHVCMHVAQH